MTPDRWQQINDTFHAALGRASDERSSFLDEVCQGDAALRQEVESLIRAHEQTGKLIDKPAYEAAAELTVEGQELAAGQKIGRYEIASLLGKGGMGDVYLALDVRLGRQVALKLLPSYFSRNDDRLRRFEQEARAASALNHPNIVTIYEFGEVDSRSFMATEFIEGETLRQRFRLRPTQAPDVGPTSCATVGEALDVAEQVAKALATAHAAGIIHRDIKPDNIMLRPDGLVKVLDFGLAKLTERKQIGPDDSTRALIKTSTGVVMGTATYMSPEQARGMAVDARTDIFSLGAVLYEMVTGRLPFEGSTSSEVVASLLGEKEPQPLARYSSEVPAELERIASKALRKDREQRYQTVKDMLLDLKSLKQRQEFEAELERSKPPDLSGAPGVSGGQAIIYAAPQKAVQPLEIGVMLPTSSAKHFTGRIGQHKRLAVLLLAALVIAAAAIILLTSGKPALTEKDTIVLADVVNTTGDAAFDNTLKQALAMQLEQSPFLNIFSEERVNETLRLMGHSPADRVTKDIAREVCQRQGLKAYLSGSISNLGSHLVITLEAVNAQTGDTLARQQIEAESKEQVLTTLGKAATMLREKLGESLASIQKYDAPIEQATTSSLEAFKAYSLGRERNNRGEDLEAIPPFKRAIELDPNFARAYDALAWVYSNSEQRQLALEASQKAFQLRDRTSEYEKLKIVANYYRLVTGEIEKAIEALQLLTRTYPRDFLAHTNLAARYNSVGRHERAIEEAREALRLNYNSVFGYSNLSLAFTSLNRFDEAKEICEQALARKLAPTEYHGDLYTIAFVRGDTLEMQRQLDWARAEPDEYAELFWQADTAAFLGHLRKALELSRRGADAELSRNLKEYAADTLSGNALKAGVTGNCGQAREDVARASALPRTASSFFGIGIALTLCGELGQAQSLADEFFKQYPKDTLVNAVWLPAIRAAIENRRNNPAQAIQFLQSAKRYDRVGAFWPEYLRGQAYLAQRAGTEAAAEFQKILDRRGIAPTSVLYPLAQLGVARAAALTGDASKARTAYQDFFALWKDADADLPVLIEAKKEYEKLR